MKNLILCGLLILNFSFVAFGQKTQKVRLENTTWKVMGILDEDYRPSHQFVYEDNATLGNIKLLAGGKIQSGGTWQLVGNQLTIKSLKLKNINTISVTLKNNTADGKGLIKNQSVYRPFRLVKM
ncbi:MAG: hypothetical protein K1X72_27120 [Pyrinomonadaceae bacterium]|nr:hypothetical protein [Pyrinomonadaceae bacterium]